jgi:predicted GNAT family acetyltransferase
MTLDVQHDSALQRFITPVGEGLEAVLEYRIAVNGVLDYHHTFVPPQARGRGIASRLTAFALDYARGHGYRVRPTCPFVARFIAAHPGYAELLESSP